MAQRRQGGSSEEPMHIARGDHAADATCETRHSVVGQFDSGAALTPQAELGVLTGKSPSVR